MVTSRLDYGNVLPIGASENMNTHPPDPETAVLASCREQNRMQDTATNLPDLPGYMTELPSYVRELEILTVDHVAPRSLRSVSKSFLVVPQIKSVTYSKRCR